MVRFLHDSWFGLEMFPNCEFVYLHNIRNVRIDVLEKVRCLILHQSKNITVPYYPNIELFLLAGSMSFDRKDLTDEYHTNKREASYSA